MSGNNKDSIDPILLAWIEEQRESTKQLVKSVTRLNEAVTEFTYRITHLEEEHAKSSNNKDIAEIKEILSANAVKEEHNEERWKSLDRKVWGMISAILLSFGDMLFRSIGG